MKTYEVTTTETVYREYRITRVYTIQAEDEDEAGSKADCDCGESYTESEELYSEERNRGSEEVTDCEDTTPETSCRYCGKWGPEDEIDEHEPDCEENEG